MLVQLASQLGTHFKVSSGQTHTTSLVPLLKCEHVKGCDSVTVLPINSHICNSGLEAAL